MFCHIVDDVGCYGRVILLPFILLFVVPCSTYLNYDEDVDIKVEFLLDVYLIGIDWVFIIYYHFFKRFSFNLCLKFNLFMEYKVLIFSFF